MQRMTHLLLGIAAAFALSGQAGAQHDDHDHDEHAHEEDAHDHEEHSDNEHDDHGDHGLSLDPNVMHDLGIETATAGPGTLHVEIALPGEIRLNGDRLAHVVPRLEGIVTEVRASLGDHVDAGDVMAVLDSRELADLKAEYLASRERLQIAQATFDREHTLYDRQVSSEGEFLAATRDLAEARIAVRAAQQRLHALGFTNDQLAALESQPQQSLTRYEIVAPIAGSIILKPVTLGEAVSDSAEVYIAADLSTLWVDLSVYPEDLPWVARGQSVTIHAQGYPQVAGELIYVSPTIDEDTRTALARVLLPNADGVWRPGLFVSGHVAVESEAVALKVPESAVQTIENAPHVFVAHDEGFEAVPVKLGRSDATGIEILSGLHSGDTYVSQGAFHLKAERDKESFAHAGHAH